MNINNKRKTKLKKIPKFSCEIIDFEILKKFNIYYQFLCSFDSISTYNEMKKRSKNELEKSTNKL